ncbi:unnamed protein product [Calicophoron daubneyi]|uniref:Dynein light chain n=1 Tax=Calicophoron daubneyi TaxID=300641 RepID=A0AAV2TY79_CALDB
MRSIPAEYRPIVVKAEMDFDMQEEVLELAIEAMKRCGRITDIPSYIKGVFDKKYGRPWHCIVGKNFCSRFTHETDRFIYFSLCSRDFLLFKTLA